MTFPFVDGLGNTVYNDSVGTGSQSNPFQPKFWIGGIDKPLPISFPSPQQVIFPFPQPISVPPTISFSASYGLTNSLIVKGSKGNICGFSVDNNSAYTRYLLFFNQTGLPSANEPLGNGIAFTIPASVIRDLGSEMFGIGGLYFNLGIVWGWSTSKVNYIPPTSITENSINVFYS